MFFYKQKTRKKKEQNRPASVILNLKVRYEINSIARTIDGLWSKIIRWQGGKLELTSRES